nr:MAG TPA: hypothetical protein [Caudoviricetes sp.]
MFVVCKILDKLYFMLNLLYSILEILYLYVC